MAAYGVDETAPGVVGTSGGDTDKFPLRILNFNVLAPSARICKPLDKIDWRERHGNICDLILELTPDIAALQEFCFATPGRADPEVLVEWTVTPWCGELTEEEEVTFKGPGPHRTTNRLLSNGHKGVVTCVLTEDDGTQSKRLFYFDEPRV
eukprot:gene7092-2774_t